MEDRYDELMEFKDRLQSLYYDLTSKDLKEDLDSIRFAYDEEIKELEEQLQEEAEEDRNYLNREYERSV